MTKKLTNINELLRQMSILGEDERETLKKELLKKQKNNVESDNDDDTTKVVSVDDEPEADDELEADDEQGADPLPWGAWEQPQQAFGGPGHRLPQ